MSNIAVIALEPSTQKWTATFGGRVLAASPNKDYVIGMIRGGKCNKANQVGVTDVREVGQTEVNGVTGKIQKIDRFGINERFDFLEDFVSMVADRTAPSLLVTGEGGLGKTFTVNRALKAAGLQSSSDFIGFGSDSTISAAQSAKIYSVVKGYSTAKGLYRTLFENRNRIVVFDDCDSILRDPVALNLLKAALDSYDKRVISWNAESAFGDDELPKSFEFTGGVIFISNMPLFKIDQAIRSRAICVDLTMNVEQKLERMAAIIKTGEFLPDYDVATKKLALEFLTKMKDEAKELSLRTLISVTKVAGRGSNWERRAEYMLTAA